MQQLLLISLALPIHLIGLYLFRREKKSPSPPLSTAASVIGKPFALLLWGNVLCWSLATSLFYNKAVTIVSLAWFALKWKRALKESATSGASASELPKIDAYDKLGTIALIILTLFLLLEATGESFATLLAIGGIGGAALAFAAQDLIANLFGGLMVHINHHFALTETIHLPEKNIQGRVEEIGWYMTKIRTNEKKPLYIPNSSFTKLVVINLSRQTHRQIKESFNLKYQELDQAKTVVQTFQEQLNTSPLIDPKLPHFVAIDNIHPKALPITLSAYTPSLTDADYAKHKQDLLLNFETLCKEHNCELT
ncbi:MAG: mechanosensitive ion channel family protein [Chlamydiia bacterium]|nr:mechanosensitive ion channel family protein [Chlamydiia bacterium]